MSVANLYRYFSTKDELMMALIEDNLRADLDVIRRLASAEVGDEQHPIRLDILAETFRRQDVAEAARRAETEMVGTLASIIEETKTRGDATTRLDAREAAALIIAFTDGLLSLESKWLLRSLIL